MAVGVPRAQVPDDAPSCVVESVLSDHDRTTLRHEALGGGLPFLLEVHDRDDRLELARQVTDRPRFEDVGDLCRFVRCDLRRRERRRVGPFDRARIVELRAEEFFGVELPYGGASEGRRHVGVRGRVDLVNPRAQVVAVLMGLRRRAEDAPKVRVDRLQEL